MRLSPKEKYLINKSFNNGIKDCIRRVNDNTKNKIAISLLNDGYSIEKVVELTKLPVKKF